MGLYDRLEDLNKASPTPAPVTAPSATVQASPAPEPEKRPTSKSEKTVAPKTETTNARMYARTHASVHASTHASVHPFVPSMLKGKADASYTFRYPLELLEKLDELQYKFYVDGKIKLPKNTIAVLGLALVVADLEEKGRDSSFFSLLVKE